jgi:hypothetical protein
MLALHEKGTEVKDEVLSYASCNYQIKVCGGRS